MEFTAERASSNMPIEVFIEPQLTVRATGARYNDEQVIQVFTRKWPSLAALHVIGHELAHGVVPRLQLYHGTFAQMRTLRNRILRFIDWSRTVFS